MAIKVGIPVSLSGQFSMQGRQTLAGIRAWVDDVNGAGGMAVRGEAHTVELVYRDDESRRSRAAEITRELIRDDRVDLLVGPYSAVLTNAAANMAQSHGRLLWNQGGASPLVYQRGNPWVVGILTPADEYLSGLLQAVREVAPNAATVGIVRASKGAFPRDVASGVERRTIGHGFRQIFLQGFDADADDFSDLVDAIRDKPPDVLVVAGRFQNDLEIAERLAEAAPDLGAVAVVAAGVEAFRERLGPRAENFIGPSQWEPRVSGQPDYGPTVTEVQRSLSRAGHAVIDYPMAQAYAVGVVIQRCVEECGSLDDPALREAASSLDFTTFYGRFMIDPDTGRQVGKSSLLAQWQQGRKVVVWPPEYRQSELKYPWRP